MTRPKVHAGLPCARSPSNEHIRRGASAAVQRNRGFPAARPLQRATRRGVVWANGGAVSRLFFARFDWRASLRLAQHARGVRSIVHFGERWPTIRRRHPRNCPGPSAKTNCTPSPWNLRPATPSKSPRARCGGCNAVVSRVMPGRERVAVLMEFLGRQTTIEVPASFLVKEGEGRAEIL